ncbi:hypothetical protein [Fibrella forsythiae]|uniref:Uncharacterized protein n=1 Tax=Fibrella forsythiae TaxID=2817061 RepID=A0ABS3JBF8_9BACT|nr:hypothetical protein [Fibrella forsythiae]MBO0947329.1 hypothetical protein [Fibrella forsythiae]
MKMAKASKADIQAVQHFFDNLDTLIEEDRSDEAIAAYVRLALAGRVGTSHGRVTWGCDILIDTCCDPDKTYLDWKPSLRKGIPQTHTDDGQRLFYIISYEHSYGGILTFWRPNNAGYTNNPWLAGTYTESEIRADMAYYHRGEDGSVAVPVEELHEEGRYVIRQLVDANVKEKEKHLRRVKLGILTQDEATKDKEPV